MKQFKENQTLNVLETLPEGDSLSQNEDCRREISRFRDLPRLSMTASKKSRGRKGVGVKPRNLELTNAKFSKVDDKRKAGEDYTD